MVTALMGPKGRGVVAQFASSRYGLGKSLVQGLLARYPELVDVGEAHRPGIVHRLDRGASGLLVVARTEAAYHDLGAQLKIGRAHV